MAKRFFLFIFSAR